MQSALSRPQRLSLPPLVSLQSYRTCGNKLVCFSSLSHWQALACEEPGASSSSIRSICQRTTPNVASDSPLQATVSGRGLASVRNTSSIRMRGSSIASTSSCGYKSDVTRGGLEWVLVDKGKSCGTMQKSPCGVWNPVQRHIAHQWLSLQSQQGDYRAPVVRVAGSKGLPEVLVNEDGQDFKRIVSESDTITTFYSSDVSASSEVEEDMDRKTRQEDANAAKAYAEGSDSESDEEEEKRKDQKKVKTVEALKKTGVSNGEMKGGENFLTYETVLTGKVVGICLDSDSESEDEEEEKLVKKEKKNVKANLKLKEKLDEDNLKTMRKEEKKQKKEAKFLKTSKELEEESDSDVDSDKRIKFGGNWEKDEDFDIESDKESVRHSKPETLMETRSKNTDLASDSEYEEVDDGVIDYAEEDFEIVEDEDVAAEIENELADEIEDELDDINEDDFWDEDDDEVAVGDGGSGGGVVLGGKEWGKEALKLAEQVVAACGKNLSIFAFKISPNNVIRVRLDKLSDRYGSPTMTDIENFSKRFSIGLEESGEAGSLPKDIDVEVSSPGAERVVRVPNDLERFKELPMYVQYKEEKAVEDQDGVFELDSLDVDAGLSVWKIANVKLNREIKGKGRPLNSQQKKWRAEIPFGSLKQVRLYLDV